MRRVKQSSLDRLNLLLEVEDLIEGLGIERRQFELSDIDLRFPCPLHAPDPGEPRAARIDRVTRYGWCRQARCAFASGGSLLWLYSRALRQDVADVGEALAARKKLMLEYEFWMGDAPLPQTDSYVYVEATNAESAGMEVLSLDDLPALVKLKGHGVRSSPLRTEVRQTEEVRERRRQETLPVLGSLYCLLRAAPLGGAKGAEQGLDLALADARFVCRELLERYRVPEEALLVRFSSEGVQLEADHRVFGAQPDAHLARAYRRMMFLVGGVDEEAPARPLPGGRGHPARCPTLAQDAYRHDFTWPCEGARTSPDGLYTIWISLHELMEKDVRYLRELARDPRRPLDPPLRLSLERLPRGLFLWAHESETRGLGLPFSLLGEDVRSAAAAPAASASVAAAPGPASGARAAAAPAAAVVPVAAATVAGGGGRAQPRSASTAKKEESMTSAGSPPASGKDGSAARRAPGPAAAAPAGATHAAPASGQSAPAARPGQPGRGPAPPPAAGFAAGSSLADLVARITSKEQAPIPITAFGSKQHAGDGLNQALQGGLHVGQVVGLAGAAGEGKTTFALQLADGVAFDNVQRERESQPTVPVLYLGAQMRPEALLLKSLSRLAKLDSGDVLRGKVQARDLQEATRIYQSFHRHMGARAAAPDPNLEALRRTLEGILVSGARGALLVVDPLLGLAAPDAHAADGAAHLCRKLAALARELPVAVVAVFSCRSAGRGGPLDYAEELAPVAEWVDVLFGLKTDVEIERAGGVLSLDERVGWKREWKAELKRKGDASPLKRGGIDYREAWKTEYSVLMTLKSRWQNPVHTAYYFHRAVHRFEEI